MKKVLAIKGEEIEKKTWSFRIKGGAEEFIKEKLKTLQNSTITRHQLCISH